MKLIKKLPKLQKLQNILKQNLKKFLYQDNYPKVETV